VLSPRILVVDDESIVCESCQRILQEEGYEVECTQDGKEAFEKMRANPFDVVITDLKMPGIDGMDVLKILQKDYPETIIIMITGFSTVETAVEAMKLGAFDYPSLRMKFRSSSRRPSRNETSCWRTSTSVRNCGINTGFKTSSAEARECKTSIASSRRWP